MYLYELLYLNYLVDLNIYSIIYLVEISYIL